jgi:hypothetical protein
MRAYFGVLLAAVALCGALALHNYVADTVDTCTPNYATGACDGGRIFTTRPAWVDPLAIALAVAGGVGGLVMVAQARRRLS